MPREPAGGVGVIEGDRLVGHVAATSSRAGRRRPRAAACAAACTAASRPSVGDPAPPTAATDGAVAGARITIGRAADVSSSAPRAIDLSTASVRLEHGGHHHRERPVLAMLAAAQQRNRRLGARVDGEVVATETLDGDEPPPAQQLHRPGNGIAWVRRPRPADSEGPHDGQRDRLGVEAPVGRILRTPPGTRRTSGKAAMVVRERSYGTDSTMV